MYIKVNAFGCSWFGLNVLMHDKVTIFSCKNFSKYLGITTTLT